MKLQVAALAALFAPATALADTYVIPNATPAQETVIADSYNAPVFATGVIVFAASYGTSLVFAARAENNEPNHHLFVPIAGPWLALADRPDCNARLTACDDETTAKVFLVIDGIFQAGSLITMIDGLVAPSYHREPVRIAYDKKLHVRPTAVGMMGSPGMSLSGRF